VPFAPCCPAVTHLSAALHRVLAADLPRLSAPAYAPYLARSSHPYPYLYMLTSRTTTRLDACYHVKLPSHPLARQSALLPFPLRYTSTPGHAPYRPVAVDP
jgi:hypothetical protein